MKYVFIPWFIAASVVAVLDDNTGWHNVSHGLLIANIVVAGLFLAGVAGLWR